MDLMRKTFAYYKEKVLEIIHLDKPEEDWANLDWPSRSRYHYTPEGKLIIYHGNGKGERDD